MSQFNIRMHEEWVQKELLATLRFKGKLAPVVTTAKEKKAKEFANTIRVFPQTEEAQKLRKEELSAKKMEEHAAKEAMRDAMGPSDRELVKLKLKQLQQEFEAERDARIRLEGEVERLTERCA